MRVGSSVWTCGGKRAGEHYFHLLQSSKCATLLEEVVMFLLEDFLAPGGLDQGERRAAGREIGEGEREGSAGPSGKYTSSSMAKEEGWGGSGTPD